YIPRFRNVTESGDFLRGFGYQGGASRMGWRAMISQPGIGAELKARTRKLGPWFTYISGFGEMLPNPENRVTLSTTKVDRWGIPLVEVNCAHGPNEQKMTQQILDDGK